MSWQRKRRGACSRKSCRSQNSWMPSATQNRRTSEPKGRKSWSTAKSRSLSAFMRRPKRSQRNFTPLRTQTSRWQAGDRTKKTPWPDRLISRNCRRPYWRRRSSVQRRKSLRGKRRPWQSSSQKSEKRSTDSAAGSKREDLPRQTWKRRKTGSAGSLSAQPCWRICGGMRRNWRQKRPG